MPKTTTLTPTFLQLLVFVLLGVYVCSAFQNELVKWGHELSHALRSEKVHHHDHHHHHHHSDDHDHKEITQEQEEEHHQHTILSLFSKNDTSQNPESENNQDGKRKSCDKHVSGYSKILLFITDYQRLRLPHLLFFPSVSETDVLTPPPQRSKIDC